MLNALRHIGVVVSSLEKAIDMYQNYLGCELITESPELSGDYQDKLVGINDVRMRVAILRTKDNNRIELLEYMSHKGGVREKISANDIGVSHMALTVENLQELYDRRDEYDVEFMSPPLKSPDGFVEVAYAVLMGEHIIELVEVFDPRAAYSGGNP